VSKIDSLLLAVMCLAILFAVFMVGYDYRKLELCEQGGNRYSIDLGVCVRGDK